ncbi:peroxidasin homolog [Diadema setosum]|uniref:peroxidasin homolog n=1 Tax=Diadema setosum TaxID=31175 RepID=UPI003B3A2590
MSCLHGAWRSPKASNFDVFYLGNSMQDCMEDTVSSVQGLKGEDIRLPCHFQGEPTVVGWVKGSIPYLPVPKAEFIEGKYESLEPGFDMDKNFSLVITDLKVADEGFYTCHALLENFENVEKSVFLTVILVDTVSSVQGWKGEDIRLPCHFQGEPAVVGWVKESIPYLPVPKAEFIEGKYESLELGFDIDKNFNLVINDLKVADEGFYTCHALLENSENVKKSVFLTVILVDTVSSVQGWKGEDIRLPCHFQGEPAVVGWVKGSIPYQQVPKAEFIEGKYESLEPGFDIDKNFSLVITDLKVADEGFYTCHALLENFENVEKSVFLNVIRK